MTRACDHDFHLAATVTPVGIFLPASDELFLYAVTTTYQTGAKLTKESMDAVEAHPQRLPSLEKWFVDIRYSPPVIWDS